MFPGDSLEAAQDFKYNVLAQRGRAAEEPQGSVSTKNRYEQEVIKKSCHAIKKVTHLCSVSEIYTLLVVVLACLIVLTSSINFTPKLNTPKKI